MRFSGRLAALPEDCLRKTESAGRGLAWTEEMYSVRRRKETAVSPSLGFPRVARGRRRRRSWGWIVCGLPVAWMPVGC